MTPGTATGSRRPVYKTSFSGSRPLTSSLFDALTSRPLRDAPSNNWLQPPLFFTRCRHCASYTTPFVSLLPALTFPYKMNAFRRRLEAVGMLCRIISLASFGLHSLLSCFRRSISCVLRYFRSADCVSVAHSCAALAASYCRPRQLLHLWWISPTLNVRCVHVLISEFSAGVSHANLSLCYCKLLQTQNCVSGE